MKIREVMACDAKLVNPNDTLQHAAKLMKACDCGILPVAEGDRLVGMITDRDIAVRCIAEGKGPDAKVSDAMTKEVKYCFEDVSRRCEHGQDPGAPLTGHEPEQASRRDRLARRFGAPVAIQCQGTAWNRSPE